MPPQPGRGGRARLAARPLGLAGEAEAARGAPSEPGAGAGPGRAGPSAAGGGASGRGRATAGGGGPLPAACRTLAEARRWAGARREGGAAAGGAGCCIPGAVTAEAVPCAGRARPAPRRAPRRPHQVGELGREQGTAPQSLCPTPDPRPGSLRRSVRSVHRSPGTGTWERPEPAVLGHLGLSGCLDKGGNKSSFFYCHS